MTHTDEIKRRLKLGTACALIGVMGLSALSPTFAQDADTEEFEDLEEVVITGSRIKRTGFDTVNPASVVTSEFLELRGFSNVAQAINELPAFGIPGASNNGGQNSQNVGQNFVNAFGLGSQRTLTLINGRRTVSQSSVTAIGIGTAGSGLQVDLNIIPTALIERVETIYTGGAPIYGSDAIAGTVNVILKNDFEGFNVDGQYGVSGKGDAQSYRYRSVLGTNIADGRGNLVVSLEYSKIDGLITSKRPYLATDFGYARNPLDTGPADGIIDQLLTQDTNGVFQVLEPGVPIVGATFHRLGTTNTGLLFSGGRDTDGNGIGVPLIFGLNGGFVDAAVANIGGPSQDANGGSSIFFTTGADPINNPYVLSTTEANSIVTPLERYTFMSLSHYDLTDNIRLFTEALYSRTESVDTINQPAWSTTFFGPGAGGLLQVNIRDNPYLTDEMRATLTLNDAYDPNDPEDQFLNISRTNTDIQGGNENRRSQDTFRFVTGFDGDFDAFDRNFSWEVAYSYGESNASTSGPTLNGVRYALAIDAVRDDSGEIVCRTTVTPPENTQPGGVRTQAANSDIDNCVPINIMGYNQFGQDVRDYLIQNLYQTIQLQQSLVEANVAGELLELPAGPIGFAVGVAHRRERGRFDNDQGSILGIDVSTPATDVKGAFNTSEIYIEGLIPIVRGGDGLGDAIGSFVNNFELEGAIRYVDNSIAGTATTWTAGGRLNLDLPGLGDALTLRGAYTQAIRSPSITELFAPQTQAFFFANDPCEKRFIDGGNNAATRRSNCEAQFAQYQSGLDDGITLDDYTSIITNASQPGLTGGNPDLTNEIAKSFTLGFVFEPTEFLQGLSLSADYTNIQLSNVIVSLTGTQLLAACYDSNTYPDEPSCGQFTRQQGTFQVTNPITGQTNAASRRMRAIITNLSYSFDLADVMSGLDGFMNIGINHFMMIQHDLQVGSGDLDILDRELGQERQRWQMNVSYQMDKFSTLLQWRHISGGLFSNEDSDERRDPFGFTDFDTFNATFRYQINDTLSARIVVNNIFDHVDSPSRQANTGNALNVQEGIGRRFLFGINASF